MCARFALGKQHHDLILHALVAREAAQSYRRHIEVQKRVVHDRLRRDCYTHDQFMLVDTMGGDPIVVTGTANFSGLARYANTEMVVVRVAG